MPTDLEKVKDLFTAIKVEFFIEDLESGKSLVLTTAQHGDAAYLYFDSSGKFADQGIP